MELCLRYWKIESTDSNRIADEKTNNIFVTFFLLIQKAVNIPKKTNSKSFKRPYKPAGGLLEKIIPKKIYRVKKIKFVNRKDLFLNKSVKDFI